MEGVFTTFLLHKIAFFTLRRRKYIKKKRYLQLFLQISLQIVVKNRFYAIRAYQFRKADSRLHRHP